MNDLRQALDAHTEGRLDLHGVERELTVALTRQPNLAAAHGALVEALYRSGRLAGESYLTLSQAIRAFQRSQPQVVVEPVPQNSAAAANDKTQFRAPASADAEKTQFRAPRAASAESRTPTPTPMPTGSRPTSSSWNDLGRSVAEGVALVTGSIVKDRFVLEEELGRGGMGIVFKARDLRKEEAQDRNPWVAIKLLNDEFRRHPESLKALQRESRKAQHLAHANVVTVYDFDRDGGNVFMVMELLEGESLDRIIRDNENGGVPLERALRLTRDMCRAMAYAHQQGVVHSDFKPANAFLTRENVVKVFDFGIARAAKRADNVSGSTTLFDPGTLGALTPTYASCEMIEGLEPDPRDDVYAIACVAYELLTGKHPFNRSSAVEARDKRMVAKRPRGLKRHQWRAIQRGLHFNRERRTASAQQFMNELLPSKRRPTVHIGIAAVVVIGLVVAGLVVPSYLLKRRESQLIDSLTTADSSRLQALSRQLRELAPEQRAAVLLNDGARAGLIKSFEILINAATDASRPTVDYPAARALLAELQAFLPDSLAVKDLQDRLGARENDEIKRLSDRFDDYLKRGLLIDAQGADNMGTALAAIRRIDAQNGLLNDPRLPGAFAAETRRALAAGNAILAQSLVTAGMSFDAQDLTLRDLRDQVQRSINASQMLARRQALESSLAVLTEPAAKFADVDAKRAELDELRSIAPDSPVLASVQQLAQREVGTQAAQLVSSGQHPLALDLIARYADLLPTSFVEQQRQNLASARGAFDAQQAAVAQIKTRIDTLLQSQKSDSTWDAQLDRSLRHLAAYVPASDPYVVQTRARAANGYLAQARALRSAQRLTEAARMIERASAYVPQSADLDVERKLLADARAIQETAAQQRNRVAQLDALKAKLLVQARANEVNEALASFQELRANLDPNDGYIAVQAPESIGSAYLRLASSAARDGRFANAVSLVGRAQEIAPGLSDVAPARERYSRYQAIEATLKNASSIDATAIRGELERLGRQDAGEAAAVSERLARNLMARIRALGDGAVVRQLSGAARQIFGERASTQAVSQLPAQPEQTSTAPTPQGAGSQPAEPAGVNAEESSADGIGGASAANTRSSGQSSGARVAMARPAEGANEPVGSARLPPDIPCTDRLAGYGKRRQAVCYDTLDAGGRGPDLVVIPAGGTIAKPFAVGRTEISNADYALYCSRTGRCAPSAGTAELPVTGISLSDARAYVTWLSQMTGATYRLPTDSEWTHAVTAQGGNTDASSANCLVEIGGKKVRGVVLAPVQSGTSNGWGLYNALGNAQEWAVTGAEAVVRGGAFSDNMSACTPEFKRPHADAGDAVTGLRVVRDLP